MRASPGTLSLPPGTGAVGATITVTVIITDNYLRLGGVKSLVQGHTASKCQQGPESTLSASELRGSEFVGNKIEGREREKRGWAPFIENLLHPKAEPCAFCAFNQHSHP